MKLVFVDETSDNKFKDYYGICCAVIDSIYYGKIKREFQEILVRGGWNTEIEFKGSYLFSSTKGDCLISVEKRIEIASQILNLSASKQNARIGFYYVKLSSIRFKEDYLKYLPQILGKALTKAKNKGGKDVISLHCDQRPDISHGEIHNSIASVIKDKGYTLFENVILSNSTFHTVGILYADIIAYLISRIETISNDSELFDNIPSHELVNNGKIRKTQTSFELLDKVKKIKTYKVNT